VHVLAAVKMKAVIIFIRPVINPYPVNIHLFALQQTDTMISTGLHEHIMKAKFSALVKNEEMRPVEIPANTILSRPGIVSFTCIKGQAVSVYSTFPFNT
jgi:hypothetical protein